jgi:hypothetical protein
MDAEPAAEERDPALSSAAGSAPYTRTYSTTRTVSQLYGSTFRNLRT